MASRSRLSSTGHPLQISGTLNLLQKAGTEDSRQNQEFLGISFIHIYITFYFFPLLTLKLLPREGWFRRRMQRDPRGDQNCLCCLQH